MSVTARYTELLCLNFMRMERAAPSSSLSPATPPSNKEPACQLDFAAWVMRMATPAPQVHMLQLLFDQAPADIRQAFAIGEHYHFALSGALFKAVKL